MKTTLRRTLIAFASVALAAGLVACGDEESTDGPSRGGADAGADSGRGGDDTDSDAGGNPSLNDVGIGGDDAGGTPDGGGTDEGVGCFEIVQCINASDGTEAGLNACIAQGTPTAQTLLNSLATCVQNNCGQIQDETELSACQQEFCSAEIAACQQNSTGGGEQPVGGTGAYESCDTEPCQAGMACGSFDGTNSYCFPECGVGGACAGWDGGAGICAVGLEGGGGTTPTHCLPTCTDTDASSDCPSGWTCSIEQGQGVCQP